jgi:hypothetical protein
MRLGLVITLLASMLGPMSPAGAQQAANPAALAEAMALIEKTGAGALSQQVFTAGLQRQKAALESANPGKSAAINEVVALMQAEFAKQLPVLVEAFAKIYTLHFTVDELRELNAFYDSPVGKKAIKELPTIVAEGMAIGQAVGKRIAAEVVEKLRPELEKRNLKLEPSKT